MYTYVSLGIFVAHIWHTQRVCEVCSECQYVSFTGLFPCIHVSHLTRLSNERDAQMKETSLSKETCIFERYLE